MEHKQLQDKLESLDLTKIDGIQWSEEHTWSRLSGQLLLSKRHRATTWYYAIAASIVLLIAFTTGYVFIQNSEIIRKDEQNQLAMNNRTDLKKQEPTSQSPTATQPITKNSELKSTKIVTDKPTVQEVNVETDTKFNIPENLEEMVTQDTAYSIDIKNDIVDFESKKEVALSKDLITDKNLRSETEAKDPDSQRVLLTSKPIKQKKNKFSIKLFQRKNKRKRDDARTMPTLTLFASN